MGQVMCKDQSHQVLLGLGGGEPCSPPVWLGVMTLACDILCPRGREAAPGHPVEVRPAQKSVASWGP